MREGRGEEKGKREEGRGKKRRIQKSAGCRRPLFRIFVPLSFSLFPLAASSQTPDVRAHVDLSLSVNYENRDSRNARLYSPLGRPSIVALSILLESGYNVVIAERLQRLPGDADGDIFDEAYISDPGIWRIGKQYIPFGTGRLLRESVAAARIDSNLIAERVPVSVALCNGGEDRQNGVVFRIGRSLGVSTAIGEHFGISGTSLGVVRRPEDAPGGGRGWKNAVGVDASRRLGKLTLSADYITLRGGPDRSLSVTDLEATYVSDGYRTVGLAYSRASGQQNADYFRLFGRVRAARNVDLEPFVRLRNGTLYDVSVTLRVRL